MSTDLLGGVDYEKVKAKAKEAIAESEPISTQDTGANTNPRRYEVLNAFRSPVATSPDGNAHTLWGTGTNPARTAGKSTFVYTITVTNRTGEDGYLGLEIGGVEVYPRISVRSPDTAVVTLPTPIPCGDNDVDYHVTGTTLAGMDVQILGLEV